jgi:AraC-like DNA-binding protein
MGLKLRSVGWFRKGFIDWIARHAVDEGRADTPYTGLSVFRISSKTAVRKEPAFGVTLGVVVQGRKALRVDGRTLEIDPANYLVITREMQYDATVQPENELRPFLGVSLTFPPELVAKAMVALADASDSRSAAPTPAFTAPLEAALAEPLSRLLNAVDDPVERRTLAPLAVEELVFRLLRSDAATAMRGALRAGDARPITEAMRLMRVQAFQPLSVEAIARQVAMSPSHFAHRFREVARMSPMRFVKEVRLDAARTLLLSNGIRASEVALHVGYESPAHFSRDFKRRFGTSPARYARRLAEQGAMPTSRSTQRVMPS